MFGTKRLCLLMAFWAPCLTVNHLSHFLGEVLVGNQLHGNPSAHITSTVMSGSTRTEVWSSLLYTTK